MWTLEVMLGALFVLFHAHSRFNDTTNNRSTTTALRYYTAAWAYYFLAVGFYCLLTASPELLTSLIHLNLAGTGEDGSREFLTELLTELSAPLVAALFLTVLLPRLPGLSTIDAWIRKKFQYMAAIPYEARRKSAELRRSSFQPPADLRERVKSQLMEKGFDERDILFEGSGSPQHLWSKISVLMTKLEEGWEADPQFSGFMATFADDYKALRTRYETLRPRAERCFALMRERLDGPGMNSATQAVTECIDNLTDNSERLFGSLCDFISRGVLHSGTTKQSRARKLCELGFEVAPERHFTLNQILTVISCLFVILLAGFTFLGRRIGVDFEEQILLVALITTNYSLAVICAVVPKSHWRFAQRNERNERPVAFYLAAGFLAVLMGVPAGLGFRQLTYGDLSLAIDGLLSEYPWYLLTFVTAAITAFQLDNKDTDENGSRRSYLRWLEGAGQCLAMILVTLFVVGYALPGVAADPSKVPPLLGPVVINGSVALFIGLFVPSWYRNSPADEDDQTEPEARVLNLGLHHIQHF